ncbi:MAG: hydroxypyruvate isomerase family protein [Ideonella sp.]|nr:hydroxypyruvate isomerase family protein [Ideonella sp.]
MPRFAANLSMFYPELPFLDRFEAAAKDGFQAVEYLFPYAWPAAELQARLRGNGLQQVLFNAPPGGTDGPSSTAAWEAGQRGTLCLADRDAEFQTGLRMAIDYANALGCPRIHVMAGLVPEGTDRADLRGTVVARLGWAAAQATRAGLNVLIEPINTRDIPRFYLNRQDDAHALLAEVGAPNLQVQMDLYHCQIVEGDVTMKLRQYLPTGRVGHIQIAGVPGRHEPDVGELNHAYLFEQIDALGYAGWIGCEYRPGRGAQVNGTSAGLGWFRRLGTAP